MDYKVLSISLVLQLSLTEGLLTLTTENRLLSLRAAKKKLLNSVSVDLTYGIM